MGMPRPARWLLVTALVMGGLVALSLLALDRDNVVWSAYQPHCPFCRNDVKWYSTRCPACDRDFDWTAAPEDDSPICTDCLSPGEDEHVRARRKALTEPVVLDRVSKALAITPEAAAEYLKRFGRGDCGWCGGSGKDLSAPTKPEAPPEPCPVCFGGKKCITCGGDRRVRIGQEGADQSIRRYGESIEALNGEIQAPVERQREDVRRETEKFVSRWSGAAEARRLVFWPTYPENMRADASRRRLAVDVVKSRVRRVIEALDAP